MGRIRSDSRYTGRNADSQGSGQPFPPGSTIPAKVLRDDRFVRCSRCNFICHLDRDRHSIDGARDGWAITNTAQVGTTGTIYDPIVNGGCPQCGCLLYVK
jgi:hypothetical protein